MKRFISILLALAMACCMLPVTAFAVTIFDSGTCGENLTWTLNDAGTLTISGTGAMYDYDEEKERESYEMIEYAPWISKEFSTVIIEDGVTSIGDYAFQRSCLTRIAIPDSVTSIGDRALIYCYKLSSITLPNSVASIGNGAFGGCENLEFIDVDENNPYYSNDINGVLYNKDKTKLIQVPASVEGSFAIPNGVTSIGGGAFYSCYNLTSVTIPNSVTSIGNSAFYCCDGLTSISIPKGVTSIEGSAFYGCLGLTSITIPEGVTSIEDNTFCFCSYLTSISIPDRVTSIGNNAFYACHNLTNITIPDSVTSIGDRAFAICTSLTEITIPDSVVSIGDSAFALCHNMEFIHVEENNLYYSNDNRGALYNKAKTTLIQVPGSIENSFSTPDSVTSIKDSAFNYCVNLTDITMPDNVKSIGGGAFFYCTALRNITIPDGITSIEDYTFCQCTSLTDITIPDGVISIGISAFDSCVSLTSITIPGSVTSIEDYAFFDCNSLSEVFFIGNACTIAEDSFGYTTTTAYYPAGNPTWTEDVMQNYGGNITWVPYTPESSDDIEIEEPDRWSFSNSSRYFGSSAEGYFITQKDYDKLIASLSKTNANRIGTRLGVSRFNIDGKMTGNCEEWGGSCLGMSAWVLLNNHNTLWASDIDSTAATLAGLSLTEDVESAINFYHMQQVLMPYTAAKAAFTKKNQTDQLRILEETAKKANDTGSVFSISFGGNNSLLSNNRIDSNYTWGHAVIGYGWKEIIPVEWTINGTTETYNYQVLIYDCSNPDQTGECHLYYNDEGIWCIPGWEIMSTSNEITSHSNNGQLRLVADDVDIYNCVNYASHGESSNLLQDLVSIFTSSDASYTLEWGDNVAEISGSCVSSSAEDQISVVVSDNMTADGKIVPTDATVLLPELDSFTVTSDDDTMWFGYQNEDSLVDVGLANSGAVTFDTDGMVAITADEPTDYAIKMVSNDNYADLPWYKIEISGSNTSSVSTEEADAGIAVYSDNLEGISICVTSNDEQQEVTISSELDSVLITVDQAELCIREDTDGDGIYETDVFAGISGDLNNDGQVDDSDVALLLWHTLFSDAYEISGDADFNGDGTIDDADVAYLLWHTLFPDAYPLS